MEERESGFINGTMFKLPQEEEMERLRKRGERFGSSVSPAISKVNDWNYYCIVIELASLIPQIEDEEKKKKRIDKFGLSTTELCEEVYIQAI